MIEGFNYKNADKHPIVNPLNYPILQGEYTLFIRTHCLSNAIKFRAMPALSEKAGKGPTENRAGSMACGGEGFSVLALFAVVYFL